MKGRTRLAEVQETQEKTVYEVSALNHHDNGKEGNIQ